jgi:hypothetical protein
MVVYTIATAAFGVLLTVGVPTLLLLRAAREGATAWGLVSGLVGAAWIGLLAFAVGRDRETRGWVAFALVGWVFYLLPLLGRLGRRLRR